MPCVKTCCICKKVENWSGLKSNEETIMAHGFEDLNLFEFFCCDCWGNYLSKAKLTLTNLIAELKMER